MKLNTALVFLFAIPIYGIAGFTQSKPAIPKIKTPNEETLRVRALQNGINFDWLKEQGIIDRYADKEIEEPELQSLIDAVLEAGWNDYIVHIKQKNGANTFESQKAHLRKNFNTKVKPKLMAFFVPDTGNDGD